MLYSRISEGDSGIILAMNLETGEVKQVTHGSGDLFSGSCTPDGKVAVYSGLSEQGMHIARISLDGTTAGELVKAPNIVDGPVVSPDGSLLAYTTLAGQGAASKLKFVLHKLEPGPPVRELDAPAGAALLNWTPDGRALTYTRPVATARNLYLQPLSGSAEVQLTHFEEEPSNIVAYAWSRDGKIAMTRARLNDTDVVMITGFR